MNKLIENFIDWFEGLRDQPQIDEQVIDSLATAYAWFLQLSLNQKLVVAGIALASLMLISVVLLGLKKFAQYLRKWIRRKRIPKNINLHLDRDK